VSLHPISFIFRKTIFKGKIATIFGSDELGLKPYLNPIILFGFKSTHPLTNTIYDIVYCYGSLLSPSRLISFRLLNNRSDVLKFFVALRRAAQYRWNNISAWSVISCDVHTNRPTIRRHSSRSSNEPKQYVGIPLSSMYTTNDEHNHRLSLLWVGTCARF